MSLMKMVVDMIAERGCGTVDHLMPKLAESGYTRKQAIDAMQNARSQGFLWCEPASKVGVSSKGPRPAVYWPGKKRADPFAALLVQKQDKPPPVASVWELGSPAARAWPPRFQGGRAYQKLGPWNEDLA
jgi:hypothetical protein